MNGMFHPAAGDFPAIHRNPSVMWLKRIKAKVLGFFAVSKSESPLVPQIKIIAGPKNDIQLELASALAGSIKIGKGRGNVIRFGEGSRFSGSIQIVGNRNLIDFGAHTHIKGRILVKGNKQRVMIGDHTSSVDVRILSSEKCDIIIGRHCMFSRKIEIRTTDAHSIVDRETGRRLNGAGSVTIGDHVWVGLGVVISKGANIPTDSVVGAMSFVNRSFDEPGVVLAGAPAKVVRRGITWNRGKKKRYTREQLDFWKES